MLFDIGTAVVLLVLIALVFDFTNGFHDAANSIATVVATAAICCLLNTGSPKPINGARSARPGAPRRSVTRVLTDGNCVTAAERTSHGKLRYSANCSAAGAGVEGAGAVSSNANGN